MKAIKVGCGITPGLNAPFRGERAFEEESSAKPIAVCPKGFALVGVDTGQAAGYVARLLFDFAALIRLARRFRFTLSNARLL